MAEKLTPIIDRETGTMTCIRCSAELATCSFDYIVAQGIRLYAHDKVPVKFFCDRCGKIYKYYSKPLADSEPLGDAEITVEILNGLGRDYNLNYLRDKNKKHGGEKEKE